MLVNALCHKYEGTRPNSHMICAQNIQSYFLNFSLFMWFWIFYPHKTKAIKYDKKTKAMHTNKCKMYKMHENMTFNAWRVLQKSEELDQGPREQKLNHRNPSSSKWNDCLEWVSQEKWDEGWKNENRRCT